MKLTESTSDLLMEAGCFPSEVFLSQDDNARAHIAMTIAKEKIFFISIGINVVCFSSRKYNKSSKKYAETARIPDFFCNLVV